MTLETLLLANGDRSALYMKQTGLSLGREGSKSHELCLSHAQDCSASTRVH